MLHDLPHHHVLIEEAMNLPKPALPHLLVGADVFEAHRGDFSRPTGEPDSCYDSSSMKRARTTTAFPEDLPDAVDAALHRVSVGRQFAAMATDSAYLKEAAQISEEFSAADWEALQPGENS